jgi:proline dehydrogenase
MPVLRSAFIALSSNRPLRRFCEHSSIGKRLSSRFIADMEMSDALRVAEEINREGLAVTLDSLGESVTTESEAYRDAEVYHELLDAIAARHLNANVSVKLTPMGLKPQRSSLRNHQGTATLNKTQHDTVTLVSL